MIHKGEIDILNIKRCYVGIEFTEKCKFCGKDLEFDLLDEYLNYSVKDVEGVLGAYCKKCEEWVLLPYKLKLAEVTIETIPEDMQMDK